MFSKKQRSFRVLVFVAVTIAALLAPMIVKAEGPRPGDGVVVADGTVGYYNPTCTGKAGAEWQKNDPQGYYSGCTFSAQSGWTSGTVRRNVFRGYEQNGNIRVCRGSGLHRQCLWFPQRGVNPQ